MTIRTDGARWIGWLRAVCVLTLGLAAPAMAMGDGLAGSYWNFNVVANGNAFPGGAPNRTRVDATVDFDWGGGSPTGGINADDFAVRWDGMLEAPQSGNYIFSTQSDDGVRLWINGALVIDNWTLHGPTWNDSATINLVAGQRYVVRMEMFERGGGAVARLYWRKPSDISAGIARNVIPQAQLFSQVSPTVVSVVQPCNDLRTVRVTFSRPMTSGNGKASAERKQSYDIDGSAPSGINVTDAVLEADQQTVVLTLNKDLIAGNSYTLEVKDVEASDGVPIVPDPSTFTFVAGEGNGLTASYWNFDVFGSGNAFPSGPATHVRQDAPVDFNWATSSPVPGIVNADLFAVRWDGFVEAPSTGDYTFWTQSDDGVRLWVNGNLVINNWTLHGATWDSAAPVTLQAGQRYAIRMELYERTGDAVARLHWQTPGSAVRAAVPANRLSSCGGAATIDHIRLLHPGSGLTCAASDITVQACANADCSVLATDAVTVSLFSTPASAFTPAPVVLNGGSAVVSIRQTAPGPVTLDAIASAPLATAPTRCFVGAGETCVMDFHDSGFLFDVPTQTACKTSDNVTIQAVRTGDTTQTCAPAFSGARSVSFWSEYVSPASGTKTLQVNGTDVAAIAPGTTMTLNFDASASATITVNYPDAGQLNLHARYTGSGSDAGLVLDGVDAFVSKPVGFDVQSIPSSACAALNTSCPVLAAAGSDFAQSVRAVCWEVDGDSDFSNNQTTPNFQQAGMVLSHALLAPVGGNPGALATGAATIASGGSGAVTFNQQYSEVGVIAVTATAPDYLGAGPVTGTSQPIGRFTPHHFTLSATPTLTHRSDVAACVGPPASAFTYMGETFRLDFTLEARNAGEMVTENYQDAFARLDPALLVLPATLGFGARGSGLDLSARVTGSASGVWSLGQVSVTAQLRFDRAILPVPPDGPYVLSLGLAPNDIDDIRLAPADLDLDIDGNGVNEHQNAALADIRYGRLALYNAIGPELQPLNVPLQLEHFNGSGFVVNTLDSCTPLSIANLFLTNDDTAGGVEQPGTTAMNIGAGTTSASLVNPPLPPLPPPPPLPPVNGAALVQMSAPGADNTGFVDLRIDASAMPWLRFDWNGDGVDDDPTSRATFGVFRGPDSLIDMR
jgi:hypothetical protein